ncbi:uncharacterized protein LOC124184896 [Neodiprion fabricii]|uniref:uncharacterized protein LOC124184896 n=1 Tax=Neodiprion fabricii TaxID=2872261 RepID=UPI001ED904A3|nr:uncharacterized protein LOC124184896 [Neodiprion fabricii]
MAGALSHFSKAALVFLVIFLRAKCGFHDEDMVEKLDAMLKDVKTQRYSRDTDDSLKIWQEYEFGSGAGNREELIVANITIEEDPILSTIGVTGWQYSAGVRDGILASSGGSSLWLCFHSNKDGRVHHRAVLTVTGTILTFKVIALLEPVAHQEQIFAIICIEAGAETEILWYKYADEKFERVSSLVVSRRVERLEFFQHNRRNKLLLLTEQMSYNNADYSSLEIYGFKFVGGLLDLWLCQRIWMPKVSRFEICSVYEETFLSVHSANTISFYEFKESETKEGLFKPTQNITSNGFRNSVCFENGYTEYLIISGPEPALFTFMENEFLFDVEMEKLLSDLGETLWAQCLPVRTYREECLLLVQLKNLTVVGFSWQGTKFQITHLPPINIDDFQLSKITPIPKYGFLFENKLVRVDTMLSDLPRPVLDEMEKILQLKNSLEETFMKQEFILDETTKRYEKSYHKNPVITGFWNLSKVDTEAVTFSHEVIFESLKVGSKLFSKFDVASDLNIFDQRFRILEDKMEKMKIISETALRVDSPEVKLSKGFVLNGGMEVRGTLHVKKSTLKFINNFSIENIRNDFVKYDKKLVIKGRKSFPSIEATVLNIANINGVPRNEFIFDTKKTNYENVDFTDLNHLLVEGSLNFTSINGFLWYNLMKSVVWKNQPAIIPGLTVVYGEIIADTVSVATLNGLKYPAGYVLQNGTNKAEIIGRKTFGKLKVTNLKGIKTINGIPYDDFVVLDKKQNLPHQITFKNLTIEENLQIDGRITGIKIDLEEHRLTLTDVNAITADTMFTNLHVKGNLIVEDLVNGKTLSDFDDIIWKSDEYAVITGHKTFLGNVHIDTKLKVASKKYNGHLIDEFVTFSGEQEFPNLKKISTHVTFDKLKCKQLNDLENHLDGLAAMGGGDFSKCPKKKLIFKVPPILEDLSFRTMNGKISARDFSVKFSQTFQNVLFDDLEVDELFAGSVSPQILNNVKFDEFEARRMSVTKSQVLTGNHRINKLKVGLVKARRINGMSLTDLDKFRNDFEDLFDRIWNGKMAIDAFVVKGRVQAGKINGQSVAEIHSRNGPRNVYVDDGFYVKNLEVRGLVNGINLTSFILDSVFRNEKGVVLTGEKTFDFLDCQILQVPILNGVPVESILNSRLDQTLTGPVLVKGNVRVTDSFDSEGKVNDIFYRQLVERLAYLRNNHTFKLTGHFRFPDAAAVEHLRVNGLVQGLNFGDFIAATVNRDENFVEIAGTKVFTNSVKFAKNFTILDEVNGLDLTPFNQKALFVDRDVHCGFDVIFENDIHLGGDLIVKEHLDTGTLANVDIEELESSAIFLNRPSYVQGVLTFTNVTFESSLTVGYLNGINLNDVISLKENQIISNRLSFVDVTVENLGITGTVNGHNIHQIFTNTFMLSGDQTINGNLVLHGNVQIQTNFNAKCINNIDASQMATLDGDEKLTGTFQFLSPLILRRNLHVFGLVNDIDLAIWESEAVYTSFPKKQLVSGDWLIRGNVTFEKDVTGSGLLNGINVRILYDELEKRKLEIDSVVTGVKMDLKSTCQDLIPLQKYANNQVYRFKYFEYLQILEFDIAIETAHHFVAADGGEYLLINLENCFLNTFIYNGSGFTIVSSKRNFDNVGKWITLEYENQIYILTIGTGICGMRFGNLWKFEEDTLTHILDLGSINDAKKIGKHAFLVISKERLEKWSIEDLHRGLYGNSTSYFPADERMRFVPNTDRILLADQDHIREFHPLHLNHTSIWNHFRDSSILGLQAGVFRNEMFLYYDEGVSENNAFIFDGLSVKKIRQSIPTHNPKSFLVINFDGFVETFLTFVKNGRSLEIFEYRGIEGFVYRESLQMSIDKTFGFKLRKNPGLSKRNFVGAVHRNSLKILEAKMYGEKLDLEYLTCEDY